MLVALLSFVVAVGCGRKPSEPTAVESPTPLKAVASEPTAKASATTPAVTATPPVGPVAWRDVFQAYKSNEVAADLKYRGKRVIVTLDSISHIGRNSVGLPYLGTADVIPSDEATGAFVFAADQAEGIARLNVRQKEPVRFEGVCEGKVSDGIRRAGLNGYDFHVKFRDCRLTP